VVRRRKAGLAAGIEHDPSAAGFERRAGYTAPVVWREIADTISDWRRLHAGLYEAVCGRRVWIVATYSLYPRHAPRSLSSFLAQVLERVPIVLDRPAAVVWRGRDRKPDHRDVQKQ
jgi:hypothetical protein